MKEEETINKINSNEFEDNKIESRTIALDAFMELYSNGATRFYDSKVEESQK